MPVMLAGVGQGRVHREWLGQHNHAKPRRRCTYCGADTIIRLKAMTSNGIGAAAGCHSLKIAPPKKEAGGDS